MPPHGWSCPGRKPAPGPLSRGSSSSAHFLGKENLKTERGWPGEVEGVAPAPPTSAPPGIVSLTRSEARGAHQNHEASIPRKPSSIKVQTAGGARWPGRGCSHESEDGPRSSPSQRDHSRARDQATSEDSLEDSRVRSPPRRGRLPKGGVRAERVWGEFRGRGQHCHAHLHPVSPGRAPPQARLQKPPQSSSWSCGIFGDEKPAGEKQKGK